MLCRSHSFDGTTNTLRIADLTGEAEQSSSFLPVVVGQFQVRNISDLLGAHVQTMDQSIPPSDGVWGGTHPQISVLHSNLLILNGRKGYREVQFSSVTQSCLTVCNPMNHSTPGFPVHHQLPEFTQTHVH